MKKYSYLILLFFFFITPLVVNAGTFPGTNGKIVFDTNRDGDFEIYTMNTDGSNQTNITNDPRYDEVPNWQTIPIVTPTSIPPTSVPPTNNTSTSQSVTMPNAPTCDDEKPASAPYLYQAEATNTRTTLHINPAGGSYNKYYIAYGTRWEGDEQYGVEFNQEHSTGSLKYDINSLAPNTMYYFKVRAGNGCMPGDWSNNFKIKTTAGKGTAKTYTTFTHWIINKLNQWIVKF